MLPHRLRSPHSRRDDRRMLKRIRLDHAATSLSRDGTGGASAYVIEGGQRVPLKRLRNTTLPIRPRRRIVGLGSVLAWLHMGKHQVQRLWAGDPLARAILEDEPKRS